VPSHENKRKQNKSSALRRISITLGVAAPLMLASALIIMAYMLRPTDYSGIGKLGFAALIFAPQLSLFAMTALLLGVFSWRVNAVLPCITFMITTALFTSMCLLPTFAMLQFAQRYDTPVSLAAALLPSMNQGGPQLEKSVSYGTAADGTKLMLDVWPAQTKADGILHPAMVRVHGGGWTHGARSELSAWDVWLNQLGYTVFDVEYRMPPPERWRDEVGDVKCALGWVLSHAGVYQIDPTRISVMGYSAGAHLAMLAAYSVGNPELPPSCAAEPVNVHLVVNLYGPSDLSVMYRESGSLDYVHESMHQFIGGSADSYPDRYRLLSPVNHVGHTTPPTITLLGTHDRIVSRSQAEHLTQALAAQGIKHETYLLPWNDHGFDVNWNALSTQFSRIRIADFLQKNDLH